jgi:hypothetical protein
MKKWESLQATAQAKMVDVGCGKIYGRQMCLQKLEFLPGN